MAKLTDKQERFCQEYLIDLNATQAAIRAGYSKKSAGPDASRMLTNANVQERIVELKSKRSEKLEISQDDVLRELARIGFSDMADYYNESNELKKIHDLGEYSKVVGEVKVNETFSEGIKVSQQTTFKLHDKLKALDSVAKHVGFYEKHNEQLKIPIPQILIPGADKTER